jgi:hypothetical protein
MPRAKRRCREPNRTRLLHTSKKGGLGVVGSNTKVQAAVRSHRVEEGRKETSITIGRKKGARKELSNRELQSHRRAEKGAQGDV